MSDDHASSPVAARVRHVEALLERRGLLEPDEIDERIDALAAGGTPANGAATTLGARASATSRPPTRTSWSRSRARSGSATAAPALPTRSSIAATR